MKNKVSAKRNIFLESTGNLMFAGSCHFMIDCQTFFFCKMADVFSLEDICCYICQLLWIFSVRTHQGTDVTFKTQFYSVIYDCKGKSIFITLCCYSSIITLFPYLFSSFDFSQILQSCVCSSFICSVSMCEAISDLYFLRASPQQHAERLDIAGRNHDNQIRGIYRPSSLISLVILKSLEVFNFVSF